MRSRERSRSPDRQRSALDSSELILLRKNLRTWRPALIPAMPMIRSRSSRPPSESSSSRLTSSSRSSGIAREPASISRRRRSHHSRPAARVRGGINPLVWETLDAEASRPSRTAWMKVASGNSRTSVGAWEIVSQLCSMIPLAPTSVASGNSRSKNRLRQASSGASSNSASKRATAASKRSLGTNR